MGVDRALMNGISGLLKGELRAIYASQTFHHRDKYLREYFKRILTVSEVSVQGQSVLVQQMRVVCKQAGRKAACFTAARKQKEQGGA